MLWAHSWWAWVPVLLELRCCVGQPDLAPLSRVVQLLTDIQLQLQRIDANDEALYGHYQDWCRGINQDAELTSVQLSARMSGLSNEISEQKRLQQNEKREIALATQRLNSRKADLARSTAEMSKEHQEYLQSQQSRAQSSLGTATEELDKALKMPEQESRRIGDQTAVAVRLAMALRNSPDLPLSISERQILDSIAGRSSQPMAVSFLQVHSSRKSSKTLSQLKDVLQTRRVGEASAMSEERKEQDEFRRWGGTVLVSMQEESDEINARKSWEEEAAERAAQDQTELDVARQEAPLSQMQLSAVESECGRRSREYAERKRLRAQEEQVVANAKALLLSATEMPMIQGPPGFLQVRSTVGTEVQQGARSPLASSQVVVANSAAPMPALLALRSFLTAPRRGPLDDQRVSAGLRQSMAAALLAARTQGHAQGDPLQGVREIVRKMIERLLTEAAEEAEHKAWCDAEEIKGTSMQKEKEAEVRRLQNQIRALSAQKQNLADEVQQLKSDMDELEKLATDAVMERNTEHSQALIAVQGYQSAQGSLQQAIQVLQNYYQKEGSTSLLQQEQDSYELQAITGSQAATTGSQAIGLLQTLLDKFAISARNADAAEKQAAHAYHTVSLEGQDRLRLIQRDIQLRSSGEDQIVIGLERAKQELEAYQKELAKMDEYMEKVKASCGNEAEGSVARNDRRRAEIEHLQEALKILNDSTSPLESSATSGDNAFAT